MPSGDTSSLSISYKIVVSLSPQYKGKATVDLGGSKLLFNLSLWLMSFVVNTSAAVHARMSLFPVTLMCRGLAD